MRTEKLKEWGLSREQIELVMGENGRDIKKVKEKFAGFDRMKERLAQLEEEAASGQGEQLRQQADQWRQKAEQTEAEWKRKWQRRDFEEAMERLLRQSGARSAKAVRALLEEEELCLREDGVLEGAKEQLLRIQAEHSYLFSPQKAPPVILRPGNRGLEDQEESRIREIMGLPGFTQRKDDF